MRVSSHSTRPTRTAFLHSLFREACDLKSRRSSDDAGRGFGRGGVRRHWSHDEMMRVVEETLTPSATVTEIARRNGVAASVSSFAPVIVEHHRGRHHRRASPSLPRFLVEIKNARIRIGSNAPSLTGSLPLWKKREQLSSVGTLQLLQQSSRRPAVDPHVNRLLILPYCPPRNRPKATVDCVRIVFFVA
jgi:hypothetical protein